MANFRSGRIERGRVDRTTACCVLCCSKVDLQLFCRTVNWDVGSWVRPTQTRIAPRSNEETKSGFVSINSLRVDFEVEGRERVFQVFQGLRKEAEDMASGHGGFPCSLPSAACSLVALVMVAGWAWLWPMAACSRAKLKISRRWRITSRPTRSWGLAVIRAHMQVQKRVGSREPR